MDWQIGMGLADWLGIGRLVMDLQICSGLGSDSWIGNGLTDWFFIGRLVQNWHYIAGLVMDWQIDTG